ncbi:MAG: sialate O-acetylesterase [Clostridiales bacterium]|nr:sialate O-acetylesterase [Clostridiales bacterium]
MKLGEIFCDGMILQANKPIRIFGDGEGNVTACFLGAEKQIESSGGRWVIEFEPQPYGGPYELKVSMNGDTVIIRDIMVGEVILFAGQSNMQFRMNEEITPLDEYVDDDNMRIFVSERLEEGEPFSPVDGWVKCRRETVDNWSAIGYLTGLEMRHAGTPSVGVVVCSQGASIIQSWIDEKIYVGSELEVPLERMHVDARCKQYSAFNKNGKLYHFMLERLMPYSFGNVVWYQGESNTSRDEGRIYTKLLEMMINCWRSAFKDETLPFYVVQIADFTDREGWKLVQQAQLDAEKVIDGVHTVISADVCEKEMIHPVTKGLLSKRIFESMKSNATI